MAEEGPTTIAGQVVMLRGAWPDRVGPFSTNGGTVCVRHEWREADDGIGARPFDVSGGNLLEPRVDSGVHRRCGWGAATRRRRKERGRGRRDRRRWLQRRC